MYDFLVQNSIYVVLTIALMIWLGISTFLLFLDNKLKSIETQIENLNLDNNSTNQS